MTQFNKPVILRHEGSSSTSMAAIQGEEDASYLSMTKGQMSFFLFKVPGFYLLGMTPIVNYIMGKNKAYSSPL